MVVQLIIGAVVLVLAIGYAEIRTRILAKKIKIVFSELIKALENLHDPEQLGAIIKEEVDGVVHQILKMLEGEELDVLDRIEDVLLLVKIHWGSKAPHETFDFSLYDSKKVVGMEIWTTLTINDDNEETDVALVDEDGAWTIVVPDASLAFVKNEDESEFWIWEAKPEFLMILKEGLYDDEEGGFAF